MVVSSGRRNGAILLKRSWSTPSSSLLLLVVVLSDLLFEGRITTPRESLPPRDTVGPCRGTSAGGGMDDDVPKSLSSHVISRLTNVAASSYSDNICKGMLPGSLAGTGGRILWFLPPLWWFLLLSLMMVY